MMMSQGAHVMTARLRIEPQGRMVQVRDHQTLLDAALSSGLNLPHSCKSGHCASCRAQLRSGEIHYPRGRPLGLSAAEAAAGAVLLCQAHALSAELIIEARSIARAGEAEIRSLPCRIEQRALLAPDVLQVFLRLPATEQVAFKAGQYLDILLDSGRRRSFSLACPPHDARLLEIHVRRVGGGQFTTQLFDQLRDGALLRIELPIGQFVYQHEDSPLILIAGGTGFAPLKSMLRQIFELGPRRATQFFWGARTAADLYEERWVRSIARAHRQLSFVPVLSAASPAPGYETGWVHDAVLRQHPNLTKFSVYAAGPPQMIETIRQAFPAAGLPVAQLHFDSFDYAPDQASAD
jgi:CDP-4-dehydro-6-deoxyglucose reductase, E3